jgi:hypothetical protein
MTSLPDDLGAYGALGTPRSALFGLLAIGAGEFDVLAARERIPYLALKRGQIVDLHRRDPFAAEVIVSMHVVIRSHASARSHQA